MEEEKFLVSVATLAKFITVPALFFSSYIMNEAFFLISYIITLALVAIEFTTKEEGFAANNTLSIISNMMFFSSLSASFYFFFPPFVSSALLPFLALLSLYLINRLYAYIRFKKLLFIWHLSLKSAAISGILYVFITMITGNPYMILFIVLCLISFISLIEEFLIIRKMHSPDEILDSVFL